MALFIAWGTSAQYREKLYNYLIDIHFKVKNFFKIKFLWNSQINNCRNNSKVRDIDSFQDDKLDHTTLYIINGLETQGPTKNFIMKSIIPSLTEDTLKLTINFFFCH